MTTKFRTLWLLGFIGLVAPAAGCGESHHHYGPDYGPDTGSGACLAQQYYQVQWGVDHGPGTLPYSCADLRGLGYSVGLRTNAAAPFDWLPVAYYLDCNDRWTCPDGTRCNMSGTTNSNVPAGTTIVEADLLDASGQIASSAIIDPSYFDDFAISSCDYTIAPFPFGI